MAAPKGNEFWKLRSKHGRDKLFANPELLWEAACEYFQWCNDNPWMKMEQSRAKTSMKIELESGEIDTIEPDTLIGLPTARPYTLTGLCLYLNCSASYFRTFKSIRNEIKDDKLTDLEKDFLTIITRIEETIYTQKFEGATVGAFNANIIARDLGLIDKQGIGVTGSIITGINYIVPNGDNNNPDE